MNDSDSHDGQEPWRIGVDLGAAAIKAVVCRPDGELVRSARVLSGGRPLAAIREALAAALGGFAGHAPLRVGLTGAAASILQDALPGCSVNEVAATARAVHWRVPAARTVIDLGGQSSRWIRLGDDGAVADFASNGMCAAGAGAFLAQQADRLQLSLEELGRLAAGAERGATVAGRCAVFAKSDMIHLQQRGTPLDEIALGLCQALARTFAATVMQGRAARPLVVLTGGGAENAGLFRAFQEALGLGPGEVLAPPEAAFFGAVGAALLAESGAPGSLAVLLRVATGGGLEPRAAAPALGRLPRLVAGAHETPADEDPPPPGAGVVPAVLGVDVGSVSTNLVLLSPEEALLQGVYLPTRGRPIEALQEGLDRIRARFGGRLRVEAVGATGSGRHLAARLLGADEVRNEITAQMTAALFVDPEVDTIFEIGGQDSKFIRLREGRLADFEMNKICAGGTGSFLEEQAGRLGIDVYRDFAGLALEAERPCDLGARCTVFMDSERVRAQECGATLAEVCAGLAYSVARNYLEKVVAGRPLGRRILFQGGTASNRAVVAAVRSILGRPVRVHPYNRLSGAIGAALLAARARAGVSRFAGLDACARPSARSFECHHCENRCEVNRVEVGSRVAHFGDVCERYTSRDAAAGAAAMPFGDLFRERERLLDARLRADAAVDAPRERIGLPRASLNMELLPFWFTLLRELGFEPVLSGASGAPLLREHGQGLPAEVCLPVRTAAAHARALLFAGVEKVFVPAVFECVPRGPADVAHTCFYSQQLPDMLRAQLGERVVTAQFALGEGWSGLLDPALALASGLRRPIDAVARALGRAQEAQDAFTRERVALGERALAAAFERGIVVLGRPYNTHDPFLNLCLGRQLERLGLPAIPWDLLPLDRVVLDERWRTLPWHWSREQIRAIALVQRDARLFPLLVSSYGCGPDGFTVKHVEELLGDRPRLLVEFDEHRGEAGLLTRLEAFADEIDSHLRRRAASSCPRPTPGPRLLPRGRRFVIPRFSEHASVYAALLRSCGHEARVLPAPDDETVRAGEAHASGRECHPYVILAGELVRYARDGAPRRGDVFLLPNISSPCLLRQYGDAFRLLLQGQGWAEPEVWEAVSADVARLLGIAGVLRLYEGVLATDVLLTLGTRLRPYERERGAVDARLAQALEDVATAIASRGALEATLAEAARGLTAIPRDGQPGERPVIGVTGDLFTRSNSLGNADLVRRIEAMGCEAWPSPFLSAMSDLATAQNLRQFATRVRLRQAALEVLAGSLTGRTRRRLLRGLSPEVLAWAVEPPAPELIEMARPYVGARTNHMILTAVAKLVDFLRRGAAGAISAAGLNCMVGTAVAAVVPAIRADHGGAPVISLFYGSNEGPSQRIWLETFVHQVRARRRPPAA